MRKVEYLLKCFRIIYFLVNYLCILPIFLLGFGLFSSHFLISFLKHNLYIQHGARPYNPEIKCLTPYRLSQ